MNTRNTAVTTLIIFAMSLGFLSTTVLAEKPQKELVIAVYDFPPLVSTNGVVSGYETELWERTAKKLNIPFHYVTDIPWEDALDKLRAGEIDATFSGVSVTSKRLASGIQFSVPTYHSGTRIMVAGSGRTTLWAILKALFSPLNIQMTLGFIAFTALFGLLLYILELGKETKIPNVFWAGWEAGTWCALAIMTTIGFGDLVPVKRVLRIIATLMIFAFGTVAVGIVVGQVAAVFTAKELHSDIRSAQNLRGKIVGTETATVSVNIAHRFEPDRVVEYGSIQTAIDNLKNGSLDAVVYDRPILEHHAARDREVSLVGGLFAERPYAIAFGPDFPPDLLRQININLLAAQEGDAGAALQKKHFGN